MKLGKMRRNAQISVISHEFAYIGKTVWIIVYMIHQIT